MTTREIHINSKMGSEENPLNQKSRRTFKTEELIAFYHACYPGMQPTPALTETIKALQLAQEAYISGDGIKYYELLAKALIKYAGCLSVLQRSGAFDEEMLKKEYAKIWDNGL